MITFCIRTADCISYKNTRKKKISFSTLENKKKRNTNKYISYQINEPIKSLAENNHFIWRISFKFVVEIVALTFSSSTFAIFFMLLLKLRKRGQSQGEPPAQSPRPSTHPFTSHEGYKRNLFSVDKHFPSC